MKATEPEDIENLRADFAAFLIGCTVLICAGAAVLGL